MTANDPILLVLERLVANDLAKFEHDDRSDRCRPIGPAFLGNALGQLALQTRADQAGARRPRPGRIVLGLREVLAQVVTDRAATLERADGTARGRSTSHLHRVAALELRKAEPAAQAGVFQPGVVQVLEVAGNVTMRAAELAHPPHPYMHRSTRVAVNRARRAVQFAHPPRVGRIHVTKLRLALHLPIDETPDALKPVVQDRDIFPRRPPATPAVTHHPLE